MMSIDAHGPSKMEIRAPPIKCPLVPPPTGKLNICAANTKAAITPNNGICLSEIVLFAFLVAITIKAAEIQPIPIHILVSRNPSGMCIKSPF
jgi:hypothetical protein